ncbi:aspartate aminotransferase family protein [Rhodanobacter aciditrophus]|uniref:Aspartate aminotransferase family protein n=1 Tax=Rhodanobacter aciditrophus TaxID=1623218 RepID=A0ABW4B5C6_9GAMM
MSIQLDDSIERFSARFSKSKKETENAKRSIPGGFSRKTFNYGPHGIFVERGEGAYIYTIEGEKLLDLNNNFTVNILGHNHPEITKALQEALPNGISFGNPSNHEVKLAETLCSRIASVEKVKFSCSASESCITAARIARAHTGKAKIAKFEGGYHGFIDDLAISAHPPHDKLSGQSDAPQSVADSGGIPQYKVDNTIILKQNDLDACEKIIRAHANEIACIFMELQSGAGGIVVLDPDFVAGIRALTKELNILLILDETITLRAHYRGMQHVYDLLPDLTIMGKMIGGGLPIGAVGGQAKFFEVLESDTVQISGTHHGHLLATVAGAKCLEVMNEAAFDRLNSLSNRIKEDLNSWAKLHSYPFMIYGAGFSFLGYAFTHDLESEITTHRDFWNLVDNDKILIYSLEMAQKGYFPVHRGQLSLSLAMTDEDIDGFIEATKEVVSAIFSE